MQSRTEPAPAVVARRRRTQALLAGLSVPGFALVGWRLHPEAAHAWPWLAAQDEPEGAVDTGALKTAASAATRADITAARTAARDAIRPAALGRLRTMAEDVTVIGRRSSVRGAHDALALARDAGELRRVARLAEARRLSTRAVLKLLGRGAFVVAAGIATLAAWLMASVSYLVIALLVLLAIAKRLFRLTRWSARVLLG